MVPGDPAPGGAATIGDVLARVGPALLRPLTTSARLLSRVVTGVSIYDGATDGDALSGEILLAVGVGPIDEAVRPVIEHARDRQLPAVVLRTRRPVAPDLVVHAERGRGAARGPGHAVGAPGHHRARGRGQRSVRLLGSAGAAVLGDLFSFANEIARSMGGAVTIEDPTSQVLAYSSIRGRWTSRASRPSSVVRCPARS